jgi:ATP phosphoribosyltransferase regulatory subunit
LPAVQAALRDLRWLHDHLRASHPDLPLGFDLAAVAGNAYYTGACFQAYVPGQSQALLRGGRYDEVGAVFGRRRPAVGFSLDLKTLVEVVPAQALRAAIRAPWGEDPRLRERIRQLRAEGETVVCVLPGHEDEGEEYACDRELRRDGNDNWTLHVL